MAKQAVSSIERHVEKGVLGIAALALFASVGYYLVQSPNTIEISNQPTDPGSVDERVRDVARSVRGRIASHRPETERPEDPLPHLEASVDLLAAAGVPATWPPSVPMMPQVPQVGFKLAGQTVLAQVVAPSKPRCLLGRSTVDLVPAATIGEEDEYDEDDEAGIFYEPVNWVTVAAVFDRRQQQELCRQAGYETGRRRPYLVGTDLQRRRQNPDGSWPEQWEDVRHYAPLLPPWPPEIRLVDANGKWIADGDTRSGVRSYFDLIKGEQLEIIRPMFADVVHGDPWRFPESPDLDVRKLDAEFQDPEGLEEDSDLDRYLFDEAADKKQDKRPARVIQKEKLKEARALFERQELDLALEQAEALQANLALVASVKKDVAKLVDDIETAIKDREREERRNPKRGVDQDEFQARPMSPVQIVWVHDADLDSVESGAVYQYRMRYLMYNRYAAAPDELKNPQDAEQVFLAGPWSEPSDPVAIPKDTRFFLASANPKARRGVRVHLFKWYEGVWVDHKPTLRIGQAIGNVHRVQIRRGEETEKPKVNFDTGTVIVDIDYERPVLRIPTGRRSDGGEGVTTVALTYADERGELHEALLELDRGGDDYKHMKQLVLAAKPPKKRRPPDGGAGGGMGGGGGGSPGRGGGMGGGRGGRGGGSGRGGGRGGRGGGRGGRGGGRGGGGGGGGPF